MRDLLTWILALYFAMRHKHHCFQKYISAGACAHSLTLEQHCLQVPLPLFMWLLLAGAGPVVVSDKMHLLSMSTLEFFS